MKLSPEWKNKKKGMKPPKKWSFIEIDETIGFQDTEILEEEVKFSIIDVIYHLKKLFWKNRV